jgi:hypothetical protein
LDQESGDGNITLLSPEAIHFIINDSMYIIAIAWIYVTLMMSVAEATNSNGTVLGAIVTFILYGILPTALMMYLMGTPQRNKDRKIREAAWRQGQSDESNRVQPDASGHAPSRAELGSVASVREKD